MTPFDCHISARALQTLATQFVEASVEKVGTDEEKLITTACLVRKTNCVAEFDRAVGQTLSPEEFAKYNDGIPGKPGRMVSRIFQDELEGVDLADAQDCLALGYSTYRESRFQYFSDGVLDTVDWSSTGARIMATGGILATGGLIALCVMNPPAGVLALFVVGGIGVVASSGALLKNGIELITDNSPDKTDWRDLGSASAGFVTAAATLDGGFILYRKNPISTPGAGLRGASYPAPASTPAATTAKTAQPGMSTAAAPIPLIREATVITFHPQAVDSSGAIAASNVFQFKITLRTGEVRAAFADWHEGRAFMVTGDDIAPAKLNDAQMLFDMLDLVAAPQRVSRTVPNVPEIKSVEIMELPGYAARLWRSTPPTSPQVPGTEPVN